MNLFHVFAIVFFMNTDHMVMSKFNDLEDLIIKINRCQYYARDKENFEKKFLKRNNKHVSISPSGNYLVFKTISNNENSTFEVMSIKNSNKEDILLNRTGMIFFAHLFPYRWGIKDIITFNDNETRKFFIFDLKKNKIYIDKEKQSLSIGWGGKDTLIRMHGLQSINKKKILHFFRSEINGRFFQSIYRIRGDEEEILFRYEVLLDRHDLFINIKDYESSIHYALSNLGVDTVGVYKFSLYDGQPKLVFSTNLDIFAVSFSRWREQLLWAMWINGEPHYHFFGHRGKNIFNMIDDIDDHKSLVIDQSAEGDRSIVYRESMARGVEYILVDTKKDVKKTLLSCPYDPSIMPWADVEPVWFDAPDGERIPAYLYKPVGAKGPLPTVVYAHGGPSFREYGGPFGNPIYPALVHKGYAVLTVNYRGSIGYTRRFHELGWQAFDTVRGDLVAAADWALESGLAEPGQIAVMGNSYGGYLALAVAAFAPEHFSAAISRAGFADIARFIETPLDRGGAEPFRYARDSPTFGNIDDPAWRAYLDAQSPANFVDDIAIPIFLGHGPEDPKVAFTESTSFYEALTAAHPDLDVRFHETAKGHEFYGVDDVVTYIEAVADFLGDHIGVPDASVDIRPDAAED